MRRLGDDAGRFQEALRPEVAFRFGETLGAERLSLAEEEELADDGFARLDVQAVGDAIDGAAPRFVIGVDVKGANRDFPDDFSDAYRFGERSGAEEKREKNQG